MKRTLTRGSLIVLNIFVATVALAQTTDSTKKDATGMDMKNMPMKSMDTKDMKTDKATTTVHKGVGVVKSVNRTDGVITFAHEPIKSLNWPAMTMGFKVKDKAMVDKIKPGDKVEFSFVQAGKDYVVTDIR